MVRDARLALRPVDRLVLAYVAFATVVVVSRGALVTTGTVWLVALYVLAAALILLGARVAPGQPFGNLVYDFYPLLLVGPLYAALGTLNARLGAAHILAHDRIVQAWEYAIFRGQPAYELIRRYPSVFASGLFHAAYFSYYAILIGGPVLLALAGRRAAARRVLLAMMLAFVVCYIPFTLWPVAGPYFAFPHPSGPVRQVWSARLVYASLARGSSIGTAFPSSHVAVTTAVTLSVWSASRRLGAVFAVFAVLLTLGVVYCQMHYAIDATVGLAIGVGAWAVAGVWSRRGTERIAGHGVTSGV
jgi:membrane-associated phospholipid phosphatase